MKEPLPLATVHDAVLNFLRGRSDAALFGAQAVNAYVEQPRMTQDVDILSTCAEEFASQLQQELAARFHIAVRIRTVAGGDGLRIYQLRKPKNRHLVDVRQVDSLPACNRFEEILVPVPSELICQKVISMVSRAKAPKGLTDRADVQRLLLAFPQLKVGEGEVHSRLIAKHASSMALETWRELVEQDIEPDEEHDGEF